MVCKILLTIAFGLCLGAVVSHAKSSNTSKAEGSVSHEGRTAPAVPQQIFPQLRPQKPGKDLRLEDFSSPGIIPALAEVAKTYAGMNEELRQQLHDFQDHLAVVLNHMLGSSGTQPANMPKMNRTKRQTTSGGTLSTNPFTVGGLGLAQGVNLGVNSLLSSGIRLSNFLTDFSTGISQLLLGGLVGSGTNLDGGRLTNANSNNALG